MVVFILLLCSSFVKPFPADSVYANEAINLGFEPYDSVLHSEKSIIYLTRLGSKTVYSVNYETGEMNTLTLPYPANRVEIYQDQLIVTQHKMSHDMYNFGPHIGAIAVIDTETFTTVDVFDIVTDPYDIAVDKDGYLYITPGSGQWVYMKVYSLHDQKEIPNDHKAFIRTKSSIIYNEETSKVYTITTDSSPRDVTAFEVEKGVLLNQYDSPYHGDYPLTPQAKVSPDGLRMYNNSGVVFGLSSIQPGDMQYQYELGDTYNDYAFSPDEQRMFAASDTGGIDVYTYQTDEYLYTIKSNIITKKLHFHNGLIAIYSQNNRHYLEYITEVSPGPLQMLESVYYDDDFYEFYDGVTDIPIDTFFAFAFDQEIELVQPSSITITGPVGHVDIETEVDEEILFIEPDYLEDNQLYTLKIQKDSLVGSTGNALEQDLIIQFRTEQEIDTIPPVLTLSASTVQPTKNDVVITVKATDNVGIKSIKLPNGQTINKSQATYTVSANGSYTFVVEDVTGLKTTKTLKITNIDKELPKITLIPSTTSPTKNAVTIAVNGTDNVKVKRIKLPNGTYVNGATAVYPAAGNGTYSFSVEDSAGNVASKSIKVTNIYNKIPASPTVNELWDSHTVIKGKSASNMTIVVKRGSTQLGTVKTNTAGEYSMKIPKQKAGTKISVYAKDPVGQISKARVITVLDKTPPAAPVVSKITTKSKVVTGTAEKGATVFVYNGKKLLGKAAVSSNGTYKVPIALQKRGVTLQVYAVDKANNKSKATSKKVS
jgi:hypothetical protein